MSKQFIYFAGVLFLMTAAVLTAAAQENTSSLNNTAMNITMNNTTLNVSLNQTQNASVVLPINVTANGTLIAAPIENLNATANETMNRTDLNETTPSQNTLFRRVKEGDETVFECTVFDFSFTGTANWDMRFYAAPAFSPAGSLRLAESCHRKPVRVPMEVTAGRVHLRFMNLLRPAGLLDHGIDPLPVRLSGDDHAPCFDIWRVKA